MLSSVSNPKSLARDDFDAYWKLNPYDFADVVDLAECLPATGIMAQKHGRHYTLKLVALKHRTDREKVVYETFDNSSFEKFATDQNVAFKEIIKSNVIRALIALDFGPDDASFGKTKLQESADSHGIDVLEILRSVRIQRLTAADGRKAFTRLLDLPADLRDKVYGWCVDEFKPLLKYPTTPPLARTNKMIRAEVLPVFYARHTFLPNFLPRSAPAPRYRLSDLTVLWLMCIPSGMVPCISKIALNVPWVEKRGIRPQMAGPMNAHLSCTRLIRDNSIAVDRGWDDTSETPFGRAVKELIEKFLDMVAAVDHRTGFKLLDSHELGRYGMM